VSKGIAISSFVHKTNRDVSLLFAPNRPLLPQIYIAGPPQTYGNRYTVAEWIECPL
jgi:hypothetical protein